jgi:hypothetical protein
VPAFLELFGAKNSGTQFRQRKACHRYWKHVLKKLTALRFLGKHLKEADHKPSPNPIKLVGFKEKQKPRIPHFHIFGSLPGLNGSVAKRRGE